MKGDDNRDWLAWENACLACKHAHPKFGCIRLGVVVYGNGSKRGFELVPGGCNSWSQKAAE